MMPLKTLYLIRELLNGVSSKAELCRNIGVSEAELGALAMDANCIGAKVINWRLVDVPALRLSNPVEVLKRGVLDEWIKLEEGR